MTRLALGLVLSLALGLATLAPARAQEKPPAAEKTAESVEALEKLFQDLLAAQKAGEGKKVEAGLKALVLPDAPAFLKKTWGDDKGGKVAEGYGKQSPLLVTELAKLVSECVKKEQTEVKALKLTDATDADATGLQKKALEAMKADARVALYTVKLTKKGEKLGLSLWSFAFVDGAFRLLGKMRELS